MWANWLAFGLGRALSFKGRLRGFRFVSAFGVLGLLLYDPDFTAGGREQNVIAGTVYVLYIHKWIHTYMHTYIHIQYIYIYMCVYIYIYMYVSLYTVASFVELSGVLLCVNRLSVHAVWI